MRNFEKYEKEIKELGTIYFGVDIKSGKPTTCNILKCYNCQFVNGNRCSDMRVNWLYDEYKENQIDWSKVKVDTVIRVKQAECHEWKKRHFARYAFGRVFAWGDGKSSATVDTEADMTAWNFAELADEYNPIENE